MISEPLSLTRFFFLMATSPESVFINPHVPISNSETTLVAFNVGSQLPLKLTFFQFFFMACPIDVFVYWL